MGLVLFGKGTRAPMSLGLYGGYPGCNVGYTTFRGANIDELPTNREEIRAESSVDQFWGHLELAEGDIQYVRFMGGGGYGDPLDRDPELVHADVLAGLVSEQAARDIYGVVVGDMQATERRRVALRCERIGRDPAAQVEVEPTGFRLSEYLQRTAADGATQCTWCGAEVAPAGADWKDHAVVRRVPIDEAGPQRPASPEFALVQSCCPACATLLDTELAATGDVPLHDRVRRWPQA
jgi:N-methylhydantoinase B